MLAHLSIVHCILSVSFNYLLHKTYYKIGLRLVSVSVYPSASTLAVTFRDRFSPTLVQT